MQRVQAGDEDAFVALIHRYQTPLLNFFRRMGVSTDAEDLAQETFLRLFRFRRRYQPSATFATFLYTIAGNIRIDHLRKVKRREDLHRSWAGEQRETGPVAEAADSPAARATEALAQLPEHWRQALVLRLYQGLKNREIAQAMDIPVGTVKSRIFNALRTLREALDARVE